MQNRGKPAIQLDEKQAVNVGEFDTTAQFPLQYHHLLAGRSILGRKLTLGLKRQAQQVQHQP
jgi:hypothetical protein